MVAPKKSFEIRADTISVVKNDIRIVLESIIDEKPEKI